MENSRRVRSQFPTKNKTTVVCLLRSSPKANDLDNGDRGFLEQRAKLPESNTIHGALRVVALALFSSFPSSAIAVHVHTFRVLSTCCCARSAKVHNLNGH